MVGKIRHVSILLLILFSLAGCNPFLTNIYSGIDKYKMPDLGDVDDIIDSSKDDAFYDKLEDDPAAKAEVLETLKDAYQDESADDETRQEAALMAADVHLKTSNTEDVMDNFNDLVGDATTMDNDDFEEAYNMDTPEGLFKSLFGDPPYESGTPADDPARVAYHDIVWVQLEAFILAVEPLESYGLLIKAGAPKPPDVNAGDTATKALMAGLTRFITYSLDVDNDSSSDTDYVSGIEAEDINKMAYYLADPDDVPLVYNRQPENTSDEEDVNFYLRDPVDPTGVDSDGLYYAVNDGLDISKLLD
ncbi:MAG: hypothetical protein B6241_00620 [Spirochaetaceae bacterium 4572_59]|nr:MAG: hypothetical protein B6241_00620 [Spirochaetaceae bacterium 4572_59]